MSTKLHIATWKIIIESLIPTTTITTQYPRYDELMNDIYEKSNYFRVRANINLLLLISTFCLKCRANYNVKCFSMLNFK